MRGKVDVQEANDLIRDVSRALDATARYMGLGLAAIVNALKDVDADIYYCRAASMLVGIVARHGEYARDIYRADRKAFFDSPGDHADEMETSLLLHLRPDLVRPLEEAGQGTEKKSKIRGIREGWAWSERKWSKVSEDTGIGNPARSSKEKGEKFFTAVSGKMGELIVDLAKVDINNRYE